MWLAPNMVTLLGFCFILGNIVLMSIYIPDLVGPGPAWVYLSFSFGLFMYQTMDNVDGKQARRTGTSSGLGELFDHGIDSLNCTLGSLLETAAMGLGCTKLGVFTALCPCFAMFFSTWETYHTHTLYLGYFNGPTEGVLIAAAVMAAGGIWGPQVFRVPLKFAVGEKTLLGEWLGETTTVDIWALFIIIPLCTGHVPVCVYNVWKARKAKGLPFAPVFLEWTPLAIYTLAIGAWIYSPYSTLMDNNHLTLLCLTLSFVFGRMTTKMILAHLTRQPFPYWTVMLIPLLGGVVIGNLPRVGLPQISPQWELAYLWGYFLFAAVVYFRWAFLVVGRICEFLGINALTIPKAKQEETRRRIEEEKANQGRQD
jgi:ethanolaminephosphotransferase